MKEHIISQSRFERLEKRKNQTNVINDDEKYDELKLIQLRPDSDDYQTVILQFLDTAKWNKQDLHKVYIYKVHNKHREEAYKHKKKQIFKSLGSDKTKLNELPLYHGTDIESIVKILHQGFLRQFATTCVYGQGSYFARDAMYSCSPTYATPDTDGYQHILLCNVICGEWIVGSHRMKVPPCKPNNKYVSYETTVNKVNNPSVFVTYQDDQAKPLYLISFKEK